MYGPHNLEDAAVTQGEALGPGAIHPVTAASEFANGDAEYDVPLNAKRRRSLRGL